jgi:hypothetical protein
MKLLKSVAGFLSPAIGALGTAIGGPGLGASGVGLANYISGHGDYEIKQNSILDTAKSETPSFGSGSIRVKHREYLQDISCEAVDFKIQKFTINPGLEGTFPWMSRVANNFQEYELHGMVFHFKTMSAESVGSTNTALGSVILATLYDVEAPDFSTKREMESTEFCSSSVPSQNCLHAIECAHDESVLNKLYVRSESSGQTGDMRWHDFCNVFVATVGMQAASVIGELWVTYDVTFRKPRLETPLYGSLMFAHWYSDTVNTGPASGDRVLDNLTSDIYSTPFITASVTGNTLTFATPGTYRIDMSFVVSGANTISNITSFGGTTTGEIEFVDCFEDFSNGLTTAGWITPSSTATYSYVVKVFHTKDSIHDNILSTGAITYSGGTLTTDIYISRVSGLYGQDPIGNAASRKLRAQELRMLEIERKLSSISLIDDQKNTSSFSLHTPKPGTPRPTSYRSLEEDRWALVDGKLARK